MNIENKLYLLREMAATNPLMLFFNDDSQTDFERDSKNIFHSFIAWTSLPYRHFKLRPWKIKLTRIK